MLFEVTVIISKGTVGICLHPLACMHDVVMAPVEISEPKEGILVLSLSGRWNASLFLALSVGFRSGRQPLRSVAEFQTARGPAAQTYEFKQH